MSVHHCCWPECPDVSLGEPGSPPMCIRHIGVVLHWFNMQAPKASDRPQTVKRHPVVYYLGLPSGIKIGFTSQLPGRIKDLRADPARDKLR